MADQLAPLQKFYDEILQYTDEIPEKEKRVAKLYDDWVDNYEKDVEKVGFLGPITAGSIIMELYGNKKQISILDVGSGTGLVAEQLQTHGFKEIVGVDMSDKSLDMARQKNIYTKLVKCIIGKEAMPFEDDTFDVLISCGSIGTTHIGPSAFPDFARVVKPDGYLVILTGNEAKDESKLFQRFQQEFIEMVNTLENSKKLSLIEERVIQNYYEKTDGVAYIFKVC